MGGGGGFLFKREVARSRKLTIIARKSVFSELKFTIFLYSKYELFTSNFVSAVINTLVSGLEKNTYLFQLSNLIQFTAYRPHRLKSSLVSVQR